MKTRTINIPLLGGEVTIRALTWDELCALPKPRSNRHRIVQIIVAAMLTQQITADDLFCILRQNGEVPLLPLVFGVIELSGFQQKLAAAIH